MSNDYEVYLSEQKRIDILKGLLEACKFALDYSECDCGMQQEVREVLQKAINKAEGKEN
jgi:hypothetical protein